MRITLLSDLESEVNLFPEMSEKLKGEVADIELEEAFVPTRADLPKKALDLAQETDLIFVLSLYAEKTAAIDMVISKLIDVELKTGISIVKAFEETELFEMESEEEIGLEKDAIAEKWSAFLLKMLFRPDELVPEK